MRQIKSLVIPLFGLLALLALTVALVADPGDIKYTQLATIHIPPNGAYVGDLAGGNDISWEDSAARRYYVADTTTVKGGGQIDVIDSEHDKFLYAIGGFVGTSGKPGIPAFIHNGPGGILVIHQEHELWAGDGDTTTKVVDLNTRSIVATIDVSNYGIGTTRADELAYDSRHHIIMITIPDADIPYVAFISQEDRTVLGYLTFPAAANGIEQPVWDKRTGMFYLNVPQEPNPTSGQIYVINPLTRQVVNTFFSPCVGTGLALIPPTDLITSCGAVIDTRNGSLDTAITGPPPPNQLGGDEIWFNSGDERVYFASRNLGVVDARALRFLTYIAPPPNTATSGGGHSIAVDSENNHVFVPVTGVGIKVFVSHEDDGERDDEHEREHSRY